MTWVSWVIVAAAAAVLQASEIIPKEECQAVLPQPNEVRGAVRGHIEGDDWPGADMRCSSHYWNYRTVGEALKFGAIDENAIRDRLLNLTAPLSHCCHLRPGSEKEALIKIWGSKLFEKTQITYRRGSGLTILKVAPLCPLSGTRLQNPLAFTFFSTRWFNACPGNIIVQYERRADRPGKKYPFSVQNPFLFQFDWVIGSTGAGNEAKWRYLGSLDGLKQPTEVCIESI